MLDRLLARALVEQRRKMRAAPTRSAEHRHRAACAAWVSMRTEIEEWQDGVRKRGKAKRGEAVFNDED